MAINWRQLAIQEMRLRNGLMCQLCQQDIKEGEMFEIDHIIEKAKGGSDELSNLRIVHLICHKKRHGVYREKINRENNKRCVLNEEVKELKRTYHYSILKKLQSALIEHRSLVDACYAINMTYDQARYYMSIYRLDRKKAKTWVIE